MTPNVLEHYQVKGTLYICYNYTRVPNFTPFHSMASHFSVTHHFEIGGPNDPKMTLKTKRSKVLHIHVTITPKSQISLRVALWPAVFTLQAIFKQVHQITPKWPLTLKGQRYPIYMLQLPLLPNCSLFCCTAGCFQVKGYRPFWDKCTELTQNGIEHY